MHASEYGEGRRATKFLHNGDYSGLVVVVRRSEEAQSTLHHQTHTASFEIPYEHLEQLVLDKLRREMIQKMENASYEDLRKLLFT